MSASGGAWRFSWSRWCQQTLCWCANAKCPPRRALRGARRPARARRVCVSLMCQPLTAGGTAAQTMANEDSRALLNLYAIPYWATQILTWLVLPLHQLYADAGDFTMRARLRTSVRENGLFYVVLAILGLVVMIVLVITKGISVGGIVSGAVAFSLSFPSPPACSSWATASRRSRASAGCAPA